MFDIAYLPQLNARVAGAYLELFDTWDQLVIREISRRTNTTASQPDTDDSQMVIDALMGQDDSGRHQHQHPGSLGLATGSQPINSHSPANGDQMHALTIAQCFHMRMKVPPWFEAASGITAMHDIT